jgi:hypothetical protein
LRRPLRSFSHRRSLVARQVVHDDDVAGAQFGHEHLGDVGFEPVAVDRPVQHHRRDHAGHAQARDQRGGLAVAVREAHRSRSPFGQRPWLRVMLVAVALPGNHLQKAIGKLQRLIGVVSGKLTWNPSALSPPHFRWQNDDGASVRFPWLTISAGRGLLTAPMLGYLRVARRARRPIDGPRPKAGGALLACLRLRQSSGDCRLPHHR